MTVSLKYVHVCGRRRACTVGLEKLMTLFIADCSTVRPTVGGWRTQPGLARWHTAFSPIPGHSQPPGAGTAGAHPPGERDCQLHPTGVSSRLLASICSFWCLESLESVQILREQLPYELVNKQGLRCT